MKSTNRREFLKKSTATAAGLMLSVPVVKSGFAKKCPNDTINVAVVGIRGKGGMYGGGGHYLIIVKCQVSGLQHYATLMKDYSRKQ